MYQLQRIGVRATWDKGCPISEVSATGHVVVTVGSESADFTATAAPVWTGALLSRSALGSKFLESPRQR
jgi:hypothetical protein